MQEVSLLLILAIAWLSTVSAERSQWHITHPDTSGSFTSVEYKPDMLDVYKIQVPGMTSVQIDIEGSIDEHSVQEQIIVYENSVCTDTSTSYGSHIRTYDGDFSDAFNVDYDLTDNNCVIITFKAATTAGTGPDTSGFNVRYTADTALDIQTHTLTDANGSFSLERYVPNQFDTWTVCPEGSPTQIRTVCSGDVDPSDELRVYQFHSDTSDGYGDIQGVEETASDGIDFTQYTFATGSTLNRDSGDFTCTFTTVDTTDGTPWWVWVLVAFAVVLALGAVGYYIYPKWEKGQKTSQPLMEGEAYQTV
ncbi:hypothetical protein KIPB_001722 [Kipferlia bialata]|uniref:Ig-like domain-containing protein n=1 Tax=Kipferlia bialata TaxID=797122 RepID=A0A9K3CQD8_9EUKA|nr:hypothetical protein KIPB_001719 [Kipferlia bialata]GIQ80855.1 hypothetical protein KIPB_001722 [Kipferlia bialata]|eukprot:g1719.t1